MTRRVAVVGYAFRLPGTTPDTLWQALRDGRDLIGTVDEARWAKDPYLHPNRGEPGSTYTFAAGSLGDISGFDAAFFGVSPREAAQMDPQQRLLLELAWETLEQAGIKPSLLQGSRSAVYIGLSSVDYAYRRADDLSSIDASTMTGNTASIAANRLSYFFDLKGPSVTVDTACSSALVAFHLACQSIQRGECTHALAGGISLHLHPFAFVGFSKASMLSPQGTCRVFDDSGDGYARSEGGGLFLLKDLEEALADGDRILAIVAGSGTNCDGRTPGLTVPSDAAQARLLREVYAEAGIGPEELDYLEAHGTGTRVGDPIEANAIGQALGQRRPEDKPLLVGSVKSNLGHLEAASGVAGLVKSLLCLEHRVVPPSIHLRTPNARIAFDTLNLRVVTALTPLPDQKRLVIGVNSFGFGGTNAHVILTSAPPRSPLPNPPDDQAAPLLLSGRSEEAVHAAARRFASYLRGPAQASLYDAAYTAAFRRDQLEHRLIAYAPTRETLAMLLDNPASEGTVSGLSLGRALSRPSRPVFVYSGNGSQWNGMGRNLLRNDATFRRAVEEVDALFSARGGFSILTELTAEDDAQRLDLTEVAQPLLFAVQVGLTTMLRAWGVEPMAMVGHSVGEVAAAWASGALSLPQAVEVILIRSLEQGKTRGTGGMTAVGLSQEAMTALLAAGVRDEPPAIAGINSPRGVTLAGPLPALEQIERVLTEREVFFRRLPLDYPFHSPAMDPLQDGIRSRLADLRPRAARTPFFSTVTGGALPGDQLNAHYWWRNVREPVRFEAAVSALLERGANVFVEIGPHAVLRNYVGDCLRQASADGRVIPTMLRTDDRAERVRDALFQVIIAGSAIDLGKLFPRPGSFVDIPHYPWQREHCWHPVTAESYDLINRFAEHPLLGYRLRETAWHWENHIDCARFPQLADHRVGGSIVFPAAGFIAMALAAAALRLDGTSRAIEDFEIRAPLVLDAGTSTTVRFQLDDDHGSFSIRSRERLSDGPWLVNVVGRLLSSPPAASPEKPAALPARAADLMADAHYAACRAIGLDYGPAFQAIERIWLSERSAVAQLRDDAGTKAGNLLDLAQLDGCFQLLLDILARIKPVMADRSAFVPISAARIVMHRTDRPAAIAQARLQRQNPRSLVSDFMLSDRLGVPLATLSGVRFRRVQLADTAVDPLQPLRFGAVPMPLTAPQAALPATDVLTTAAVRGLRAAARISERKRYYEEVEPLIDVLCSSFAERTLRALLPEDQPIDPAHLPVLIAADRGPYLHRLLEFLQEDGIIEPGDGGWRWCPDSGGPDPIAVWTSLIGDYPDFAAPVIAAGRVGLHLPELLAGRLDSATLTQADACARALTRATHPCLSDFHTAAIQIVQTAVAQLPTDRRLRLLEACSGQALLAHRLLPLLDQSRVDYLLTTPPGHELADRNALLQRFPCARVQQLDLAEPESLAPGDGLPCVDILLLPEGLAELSDVGSVLASARKLLAQEGLLLVLEEHPSRSADLVWGAQQDWWRPAADSGASRLRSAAQWRSTLTAHGFDQIRLIQDVPGIDAGYFLLLGRNSRRPVETASDTPVERRTWMIVCDSTAGGYAHALGSAVSSNLRSLGHQVLPARPGRDFAPELERSNAEGASDKALPSFEALLKTGRDQVGEVAGIVLLCDPDSRSQKPESGLQRQRRRCEVLLRILNACRGLGINPPCWLVTSGGAAHLLPRAVRNSLSGARGCSDAAFWGFARTVMNEYPEVPMRLIDCADPDRLERMATELVTELLAERDENEVILTGSGRFVARLEETELPADTAAAARQQADEGPLRLDFAAPGPLKNLHWRRVPAVALAEDQVEIAVRAAGLNFRDVMYAMGLLSDEAVEAGFAGATLGMELAGVIVATGDAVSDFKPGDAVMAFAPASFATRAVTQAGAVAHKPAKWSFEAAATVPIAFFTVYYALRHLAQLAEGERILIHGAAGGVGIAAIQLAHYCGAEIFATAGSDEKRDFVRLLGADHVFDSRSLAFADEILELTGGEGVDVVLNSLAGEAIDRNLRVLRPFGRFLELGKRDFYENTKIGLRPFRNNIAYFGIDADQLMVERPELTRRLFGELLALFESEALKPLPFRAFSSAEVVEAFRHMQQSRHIGKIVVTMPHADETRVTASGPVPALSVHPDKTYLVSGGLSGFGLEAAKWLSGKGARHLVLIARSDRSSPEAQAKIEAMRAARVAVRCVACDVTDRTALDALLDELGRSPAPLAGIIHAAAVMADGLSHTMSGEQILQAFAPKMLGAQAFAAHARRKPLDFLIFFSSATTLFGNPGQANYVGANHFLEALTEELRAEGIHAYCMGFGPIADAGYLARNERVRQGLEDRLGGQALSSSEALNWLERMIAAGESGLGIVNVNWNVLRRVMPTAESPKYRAVLPPHEEGTDAAAGAATVRRWLAELPDEQFIPRLVELLKSELAEILKIAHERLDEHRSVHELGMDSLMGMELITALEKRVGVRVPVMLLSEGPSILRLAEKITRQLRHAALGGERSGTHDGLAEDIQHMAAIHAGELSREHIDALTADFECRFKGARTNGNGP